MTIALEGLEVSFHAGGRLVPAVRGVTLAIPTGSTAALVGESGCGKSTTAHSVLGLLAENAEVLGGTLRLDDESVSLTDRRAIVRLRGRRIGMVFQDAMTCLNPVVRIGTQMVETLQRHRDLDRRAALARAEELLYEVGVNEPARRLRQYPHQLSGGMRQRVAIAIAIAPDPQILIADEPTTALDVTVEAQILDLLVREQQRRGMTLLIITHDLGVVARVADHVAVMYAGRVVEHGEAVAVFRDPEHPYTRGLLAAVAAKGAGNRRGRARFHSIRGAPPAMDRLPPGCPFEPRCEFAVDRCVREDPPLTEARGGKHRACWVEVHK